MPITGTTSTNAEKFGAIEEEIDLYEAFAPHVDTSQITTVPVTPPGKSLSVGSDFTMN